MSRLQIGLFLVLNVVLTFVERNIVRMTLMNMRRIGLNLKHILLVGYSRAAEEYIDRITQNPQWGYNVMGILDDSMPKGTTYKNIEVIGRTDALNELLEDNHPDEIAITLGLPEYYKLERIVAMCEKEGSTQNLYRITVKLFRQNRTQRICSVWRSLISATYRFPIRLT